MFYFDSSITIGIQDAYVLDICKIITLNSNMVGRKKSGVQNSEKVQTATDTDLMQRPITTCFSQVLN